MLINNNPVTMVVGRIRRNGPWAVGGDRPLGQRRYVRFYKFCNNKTSRAICDRVIQFEAECYLEDTLVL